MIRTVDQAFQELLKRQGLTLNQMLTAMVRVDEIRKFFSSNFEIDQQVFSIGSYARSTMGAGEKDIDLMAPFQPSSSAEYWEKFKDNSSVFLYEVRNYLNERYSRTEVSSKKVAVTLNFTDIKVDVVPCFPRKNGGYFMPNGKGGWQSTNPTFHTNLINNDDQIKNNTLKPEIRLAKDWNKLNGAHLRSFHVELMVASIWRDTPGPLVDLPHVMKEVLRCMPIWLSKPFYDPWNVTVCVDDYLGTDERKTVTNLLNGDCKRAEEAILLVSERKYDEAFEKWDTIFYRSFPPRYYQ